MKCITLKAETIGELTKLVDDFKPEHEIISIAYNFNTIEYNKSQEHYVEAIIEYK